MIKYGILHKESGKLLRLETYGNMDHGVDYSLDRYGDDGEFWLVDDQYHAEFVRLNKKREVYAQSRNEPNHSFEPDELEVVEVKIETASVVPVILPSFPTLIEKNHPTEKEWAKARIKEWEQDKSIKYDLSSLFKFMGKWG